MVTHTRNSCSAFIPSKVHTHSSEHTRAGPEYSIIRIFVRWVGIRFSILRFEFWISLFSSFFFNTWHPPRNGSQLVRLAEHLHQQQTVRQWKTFVLTYSMHIFHEKSSISYKRACRTSTFEIMNLNAQKTQHVNGPSAITKPNAMHVFSFCQLSRDASESLGSACSSSCSADEMRWCEAALRRGPAESLTLFSNDWFNLIVCVDLFTHLTYMLYSINVCRNFTHYKLESCGNE